MATYLPNVVTGLTAYGYGDTRNGLVAYTPIYDGFPEYAVKVNSSFFVETGSLFVPALFGEKFGYNITYLQPGWSYRSRNSIRPTFVPFRKDFFDFYGASPVPTFEEGFDKLNFAGEPGEEQNILNVFKIKSAGFLSYSARTLYQSPKDLMVSANGQFTLQYIAYPWPEATSAWPINNFDGMQIGTMIKFFTEDQYSIITFEPIEEIRKLLNLVPTP